MATAIERWLDTVRKQYEDESDDPIVKRFCAPWKSAGDHAALLFRAVQLLEQMNARLDALAGGAKVKAKR